MRMSGHPATSMSAKYRQVALTGFWTDLPADRKSACHITLGTKCPRCRQIGQLVQADAKKGF